MANDTVSLSWFVVLNNPEEHGFSGTPQEICQTVLDIWTDKDSNHTGAVVYCISATGLHHLHCVFESKKVMRFSAIKKLYPSANLQETKGNKKQVEDYIMKQPPYDEKGEVIVCQARKGKLKGACSKESLFPQMEYMLSQGMNPEQIMSLGIYYRQHENLIRKMYFVKRFKETPVEREVHVYWHVGEAGSGKSYTFVKLCEKHGEDSVYMYSDSDNGALDRYQAEPILFIDEFKGQMSYARLLRITDKYKTPLHARYADVYALWNEVHITSVFPPESVYQNMVNDSVQGIDSIQQLLRRLTAVIYHYKKDNEYCTFELAGEDYISYTDLKLKCASQTESTSDDFLQLSDEEAEQIEQIFM